MRLLPMLLLSFLVSACEAGSAASTSEGTQVYTQDDVLEGVTATTKNSPVDNSTTWATTGSATESATGEAADDIGNLIRQKTPATPTTGTPTTKTPTKSTPPPAAETSTLTNSATAFTLSTDSFSLRKAEHVNILYHAEQTASPAGQHLLAMARKMALEDKEIVPGACWDYINTLWNRAGYPAQKRTHVHKGRYHKNPTQGGPFADSTVFQAGDWLYYINHNYHDIEHSAMFVGWVDKPGNIGLMLTYGGENRAEPARFREYDLNHVYTVVRAVN